MAARLYLTSAAAEYAPPTIRGSWDETPVATCWALKAVKSGANLSSSGTETSTISNRSVLLGRWVLDADRIAAAGNLAGTCQIMLARQATAGPSVESYLHIHVLVGSTDVVRGTPYTSSSTTNNTTLWTATLTAATYTVTLTSVAVQPGDRVVVECGFNDGTTNGTSSANMRHGGTDAADLAAGTAAVTTASPWVQFSDTGAVFAVAPAQAAPTNRFFHVLA